MKIIENNLKNFIEIPNNVYDLTNDYITEVESFNVPYSMKNLVVGRVLELEKHENADTLSVTQVDLGHGNIQQIVCGASNVKKGQSVIVATEGAILPGDFKIKKSKIRGVESNGMICSLQELGFKDEVISELHKDGIYYFNSDQEPGSNPFELLEIAGFTLELDLTPNRGDLLSHYGYALDLAAATNTKIKLPKIKYEEIEKANPLKVKIESTNTNSYYARYFDNVLIKESPLWLRNFLDQVGVKPVNNIVDITNYILFTYGIPMHAFDALKFGSKDIVVKDNKAQVTVLTLDDQEHNLTGGEILITNGNDIKALGGVMGLDNSKIDENTKEVILEIASFSKETTGETSKKLNLKSDSSLRFERGIDENIMMQALDHATYLIKELSNANIYKGISSNVVKTFENKTITVDIEKLVNLTGDNLEKAVIINILNRLNYEVKEVDNNLEVKAPSYRHDILIFEDVLEEVIRIYGMNNIKNKPMLTTSSKGLSNKQKDIRNVRNYLSSVGLNEVINYSLKSNDNIKLFDDLGEIVQVLKPMSHDRTSLRQSLINGLIETKKYNLNHSNKNVNIFEIGNVFAKGLEEKKIAVLLSNNPNYNSWKKTNTEIDFYYLSGLLANLLDLLNIDYRLEESTNPNLHPHQQGNILVGSEVVGIIGKVHPKLIESDTFVFEINYDLLKKNKTFKYEVVSKYPTVERDIAFLIKDDILVNEIIEKINQTARKNLVKLELFDVYKGSHTKEGYQSLAFKLTLSDDNKTLTTDDINKIVARVLKRLEFEYQIEIRQ